MKNRWISVIKRLPKQKDYDKGNGILLVKVINKSGHTFVTTGVMNNNYWWIYDQLKGENHPVSPMQNVVEWATLPQPPKNYGFLNVTLFILWKIKFRDWLATHFPFQIPLRKPKPPTRLCPDCGKPLDILTAYNTGEGWDFSWNCPDFHDDGSEDCHIVGWYPYLFGVWCTGKDLEKIGICEV